MKWGIFRFIYILLLFLSYTYAYARIFPSSNIFTYDLVWYDEFDRLEKRWEKAEWTFKENECEFDEDYVSLKNGTLRIQVAEKGRHDQGLFTEKKFFGGEIYTSSDYKYGRYVVNMKPDCPPGVVASFFMFAMDFDASLKPKDWAEFDIEFPGTTEYVQFNVRWMEEGSRRILDRPQLFKLSFDASKAFHAYAIEWTPYYIAFYIDNQLVYTFDDWLIVREFTRPMSIRMNYWVSNDTSWAGELDTGSLPRESTWDYVKYLRLRDDWRFRIH